MAATRADDSNNPAYSEVRGDATRTNQCSVHEWVAALKNRPIDGEVGNYTDVENNCHSFDDQQSLSVRRNLSKKSPPSVHSLLHHRGADPEQVLYTLGFGGADVWRRIPERFFKFPSQARGISVTAFKEQQNYFVRKFEFGFSGYRGLQGSLNHRPSEMVATILNTLMETEQISPTHCTSKTSAVITSVEPQTEKKVNYGQNDTKYVRKAIADMEASEPSGRISSGIESDWSEAGDELLEKSVRRHKKQGSKASTKARMRSRKLNTVTPPDMQ